MTTGLFERRYGTLRRMVDRKLVSLAQTGEPCDVRNACRYVLAGKGKRVRAVVVMLSAEAVGGTARGALNAAAAVEVLHDFTLVHDDIMDDSATRRGGPTVHIRWDVDTAILTGDVLLGIAYRALLGSAAVPGDVLARLFTRGMVEVCEGQALDLAFERRSDVTVNEYFRMIEKKTAALLSTAAEIGGVIGGAAPRERAALAGFGRYLGRAFQLQDDLLDVIADENRLGKPVGGDILERKKTFLLLRAAERARREDAALFRGLLAPGKGQRTSPARSRRRFVERVTTLYRRYGVLDEAQREIRRNTNLALRSLRTLRASRSHEMLAWLAGMLVDRSS